MRKVTLLAAVAVGAWAGYQAARTGPDGGPAPSRRSASPLASELFDAVQAREALVAFEKLGALLALGRERGIEIVQGAIGGRTGHTA